MLGIIRDTAVSLNGQHTPMTESRQNDFQHRMTTLLVNLLIRNPECAPQKYMQYLDQNAVPLVALQKALDHSLGLGLQVGMSRQPDCTFILALCFLTVHQIKQ